MADEATRKNPEKSTSDELEQVLSQLTTDQLRFAVARQGCSTTREAADAVGIKPNTVYGWPAIVKEAVRLLAADTVRGALHIRQRNLVKAMMVKAGGLDSDSEGTRQRAATEIIEWELGRAMQRHGGTGDDDEIIVKILKSPEWIGLRTQLLEALAAYPEAKIALAEVLDDGDS